MNLLSFPPDSDQALEVEIIQSDRFRATLVGSAFLVMAAVLVVVWSQASVLKGTAIQFLVDFPFGVMVGALVFLGVYEWAYWGIQGYLLVTVKS